MFYLEIGQKLHVAWSTVVFSVPWQKFIEGTILFESVAQTVNLSTGNRSTEKSRLIVRWAEFLLDNVMQVCCRFEEALATFHGLFPCTCYHRWENPLMGWTSTADPLENTFRSEGLAFYTKEEAVDFCKRHGWRFEVLDYNDRKVDRSPRFAAYGDNFR